VTRLAHGAVSRHHLIPVIESAPLVLGGIAPHSRTGYGKFGGAAGIESFTEQRWVTIQHSGRPTYPF
jgi:hypothetical protein